MGEFAYEGLLKTVLPKPSSLAAIITDGRISNFCVIRVKFLITNLLLKNSLQFYLPKE